MTSFSGNFWLGLSGFTFQRNKFLLNEPSLPSQKIFGSTISAYSQNCRLGSTISLLSKAVTYC